jgi:hypothetical protein
MSDININSHQTQQPSDAVLEEKIQQYIKQLDEQQQLVLKIAMEHLESSFDISKSVGFVEWNK